MRTPSRTRICGAWLAVSALALAASTPGPGFAPVAKGQPQNANHILGINLAGLADWNTELPFVDAFRLARHWVSQRKGEPWGKGPALQLDEHGWVKALEPDCWADTPLLTFNGHKPAGDYTLLYDGEGDIQLRGAKLLASEPGRLVVSLDQASGGVFLQLRKTNPANYVRNIRFILPGYEKTHQTEPFRPGFLELWRGMNAYRFMDWMHTNGSPVAEWADRPKMTDATWTIKGAPLEVMIDLCNRQLINPWFCIPHKASDDFVRKFATMVRDRLDPTLHIYIEYSNEVWNGIFAQSKYAQERAKELGIGPKERPWEGGGMWYAQRSVEIFKLFEEVFGGRDRLVRVLAWQSGNAWWLQNILLPWKDTAKQVDAIATAPYLHMCFGPRSKPSSDEVAAWSVDQVLDYAESKALPDAIRGVKAVKALCDKHGFRLLSYEAGQHLVGVGGGQDNDRLTALCRAANCHPRMGDIYRKYYDAWRDASGDLMAVFSSIGRDSKWGCWGQAEYWDETPADRPKLKATLDWNAANPLKNAPPAIEGLADATVKLGQPLSLKPTITDDAKSRMPVIVSWSSSAVNAVTFSAPLSPQTEVRFARPGSYTLLLRASDGFARCEKAITITVE